MFFEKKLQIGHKMGEMFAIASNDQLPILVNNSVRKAVFSTEKTDFQVPFIQPLSIGLNCNHIYNQVVYIDNSNSIYSSISSKQRHFRSLSMLSKENENSFNKIEELIEDVLENELKFVNQHYSILFWDDDLQKLANNRSKVENVFKDLNIKPYQIKYALKDVYMGNCPGAAGSIPEEFKFTGISEQTPIFFNIESFYDSNASGILFSDRENESPIRLDLWDEPLKRGHIVNRNRLVFGPSGTGKSFLINHIASQYYEQGHHIIMIDIGNSYKKLCNLAKGSYFSYDPEDPLEFNPFVIYEEEVSIDKKVFLISVLIFLWKGEEPYSIEEKQIISKYIDAYYDDLTKSGNLKNGSFSSFFLFMSENSVMSEETRYFDKISFRLTTQDFHDGKYSELLNSPTPINLLDERFIVFEMDNIKDHPILFPLVTMLCIDVIMAKIQKRPSVKKTIFIDECWKPISKGEMAEFIKYLYKTVRKFNGEVAIATQDMEDILETVAGPAMINNTDTMILLSHKKKMSSKDKFAKYLSFSETDLDKLFSTDKREVFIKMGNTSNVYKVKVSPERYACYTSNADENKIINDFYEKHGNMTLALQEFIEHSSKK
jgi:conjugation system TraG family ATPase